MPTPLRQIVRGGKGALKGLSGAGTTHAIAGSMTDTIRAVQLEASVVYSFDEIVADVRDRRANTLALFGELDEAQREQLVVDAWSIGLRALHNAHSAAQESTLKDVGEALVSDVDRQLRAHVEQQQA